jgi:hypothetical protein
MPRLQDLRLSRCSSVAWVMARRLIRRHLKDSPQTSTREAAIEVASVILSHLKAFADPSRLLANALNAIEGRKSRKKSTTIATAFLERTAWVSTGL